MQALFEPVDLSELTADLAGVFDRPSSAAVCACRRLSAAAGAGLCRSADVEKIVLNLLSNAFKFTFDGDSWHSPAAGDRVVLQVADTGVGIPADQQARIFERFHRIAGTRARTHEGSGIGLALVNDLVRLHGGAITVASEPGGGATFSVILQNGDGHLPADRVGVARSAVGTAVDALAYAAEAERWLPNPKPEPTLALDTAATGSTAAPDPADLRILVADDNADMRDYLTRLLSERWSVETASDGLTALAAIHARRPTLVLTDVMMPGLDGFELLREIRRDPGTRNIPVIMLSARAGEESRIEGFEAGADDYLVKPFSARELMARVATRLDLHRLGQRLDRQRTALADLFRQTPLPVAVLRGPNLVFDIANDAYLEVIGHRDIVGRPLLEAMPELAGQGYDRMLARVMETGVATTGREEMLKIARHGRLDDTYWTFIYSPLVGDDGTCDGVVAICSDVTAQVHARHKLEALAAAAEAAQRARAEFLAMLGHQLRNPLAPIMTAVQFLHLTRAPDIEQERTIIEPQTKHLVPLVDDLLDVSRIARGKIELKKERVDAASVVARAIEQASPLFEEREQRLDVEVPAAELTVDSDPGRLAQAIANLLMNAAKYTEQGGHIRVQATRDGADVVITVRDNGIGIEPDMLPHVFDLVRSGASGPGPVARRARTRAHDREQHHGHARRLGDRPQRRAGSRQRVHAAAAGRTRRRDVAARSRRLGSHAQVARRWLFDPGCRRQPGRGDAARRFVVDQRPPGQGGGRRPVSADGPRDVCAGDRAARHRAPRHGRLRARRPPTASRPASACAAGRRHGVRTADRPASRRRGRVRRTPRQACRHRSAGQSHSRRDGFLTGRSSSRKTISRLESRVTLRLPDSATIHRTAPVLLPHAHGLSGGSGMLRSVVRCLLAGLVGMLAVAPLFAHHAITAKFDPARTTTIVGQVTKVDWANPHVHILMNVVSGGRTVNWAVELESRLDLERSGGDMNSPKPGESVTVHGIRARDGSR